MYIIYFTAGAKKFPEVFTRGQVLNIFKNLLFDKQLVLYDDPRNSPEAMFTQAYSDSRKLGCLREFIEISPL